MRPASPDDAIAWLEEQHRALVPLVRAAARARLHKHAWRLAVAWAPYFELHGPLDHWRQAHEAVPPRASAVAVPAQDGLDADANELVALSQALRVRSTAGTS